MDESKRLNGFTLAEIVVTLFVVAVIALVSFGITKYKLDHTMKYSYFATFDVLRESVGNIVADSDIKVSVPDPNNPSTEGPTAETPIGPVLPETGCNGSSATVCVEGPTITDPTYNEFLNCTRSNSYDFCQCAVYHNGCSTSIVIPESETEQVCRAGEIKLPDGTCQQDLPCTSDSEKVFVNGMWACVPKPSAPLNCTFDYEEVFQNGMWICAPRSSSLPFNYMKDYAFAKINSVFAKITQNEIVANLFGNVPKYLYMKTFASITLEAVPSTETPTIAPGTAMPETSTTTGDGNKNITILPQTWSGDDGLCEKISETLNTKKISCSTFTTEGNFTEDKAAMILSNGVRLFMVSDTPALSSRITGSNVYQQSGYTIYADVDGSRGKSILYEDVFPYFITLTGKVIPEYDLSKTAGGNDKSILSVSVKYDNYSENANRKVEYIIFDGKKETSFYEAACSSGYLEGSYCGSIIKSAVCTFDADCTMVFNKPFKI